MTAILTPRVYTSRDPGAPVMRGDSRLSVLNVLQAVLVDGYGTAPDAKESLGWESTWNPAETRVAFRSLDEGSNRLWLYFDSTQGGISSLECYVFARGYTDFIGWSGEEPNGSGVFGNGALRTSQNDTTAGGERDWFIIGTSRSFYLWIQPQTGGTTLWERLTNNTTWVSPVWFFGDLAETTGYNTILTLTAYTLTNVSRFGQWNPFGTSWSINTTWNCAKDSLGVENVSIGTITAVSTTISTTPQGRGWGDNIGLLNYPDPHYGLLKSRVEVFAKTAALNFGHYIGRFPGLWAPGVKMNNPGDFNPGDVLGNSGERLLIVPASHSSNQGRAIIMLDYDSPWYAA